MGGIKYAPGSVVSVFCVILYFMVSYTAFFIGYFFLLHAIQRDFDFVLSSYYQNGN